MEEKSRGKPKRGSMIPSVHPEEVFYASEQLYTAIAFIKPSLWLHAQTQPHLLPDSIWPADSLMIVSPA